MVYFRLKRRQIPKMVFKIVKIQPSKKAVLIGCNYLGTQNLLYGCINDVHSLKQLLTSSYKYKPANIQLLTDNTLLKPTKANILTKLTQLLQNSVKGDNLLFMFSGHGSYTNDTNRDELDGYDECIYTKDNKFIVDDEFKKIITTNLKAGTTLFCIFDSCFSGTVMDLRYNYLDSLNNNQTTINMKETETKGLAIVLSGCSDIQTSSDATFNNKPNGALTWAFLQVLQQSNYDLTWHQLIDQVRTLLSTNGFSQLPQLSSSLNIDIDTKMQI